MFETKMLFSSSRHFTPLLLPLPPIFSCSSTESNSSCMSLTAPLFCPFSFLCQCARGSKQCSVQSPGEKKKKRLFGRVFCSVSRHLNLNLWAHCCETSLSFSVYLLTFFFSCPIKIKQIADLSKSEEFTIQGCF